MGIEPPFGALNKYFSGDGIPQDPEDDDWKQRPRYACPRKAVAVCFFWRFQQEATRQKGWVN